MAIKKRKPARRQSSSKRAPSRVREGDCLDLLSRVSTDSIPLAFADPPFNIGYSYDTYHDRRSTDDYLDWSTRWMSEIHRVLQPNGTFWLAIGDEYAAELKVIATRELGFVCRSWVVWYYTFGVNCQQKFNRSHAYSTLSVTQSLSPLMTMQSECHRPVNWSTVIVEQIQKDDFQMTPGSCDLRT